MNRPKPWESYNDEVVTGATVEFVPSDTQRDLDAFAARMGALAARSASEEDG